MKVLVTGSAGRVGRQVVPVLGAAGHDVVGFDLVDGYDVRDARAMDAALRGVDAVVHLAVVPWNAGVGDAALTATNVGGTATVLSAAATSGARRLVYASSVNAFGVFLGLRAPDYLPIDDDHPCYATSVYGVSKLLGEELCELTTRTTGLPTLCLRIPVVIEPDSYATGVAAATERGAWEYGAFVDARDLARAIVRAVEVPWTGHARVLVAGSDAMAVTPPVRTADRLFPDVRWNDRAEFEADPWRPLVRAEGARALLGWSPVHTWAANVDTAARRRGLRPFVAWCRGAAARSRRRAGTGRVRP